MNKNPLIPTATVDKNGRQTTVHKRMERSNGTGVTSIPKVALPQALADRCHLIINFGFESDTTNVKMSDNVREKMMNTLDPHTLDRMETNLRESGHGATIVRKATY